MLITDAACLANAGARNCIASPKYTTPENYVLDMFFFLDVGGDPV
jgi:hypothetical protein